MTKKIPIASRGEVAARIVYAYAEMGICLAVVYSEADRHALHVKRAGEAHSIGAGPLADYLNPRTLVNLAVGSGCDALHPGRGFLSENAKLAEICTEHGIKFIDPSTQMIRRMGDKTGVCRSTITVGVSYISGAEGSVADFTETLREAERISYPAMPKATSGGGGRGIRRCNNREGLEQAFPRVISGATKAFGSAEVLPEKCIVNPKRIEAQILADSFGSTVHLFERDCSIQHRNQKLIEIAPSPQPISEQRAYIGDLAVRTAEAVGYENASIVEFLLADGEVYFTGMDTRVQVKHTITEETTGIGVVREQIRVASGLELLVKQDDTVHRGYALQFRINAEDPKSNLLLSLGKVTRYYTPSGPGIRTDTAIYTGYIIPPYYDSTCLKLTVQALTQEKAFDRGLRTLDDTRVRGVKATAPYYQGILRNPEFRSGQFNTGFVKSCLELIQYSIKRNPSHLAIVIVTAIMAHIGL